MTIGPLFILTHLFLKKSCLTFTNEFCKKLTPQHFTLLMEPRCQKILQHRLYIKKLCYVYKNLVTEFQKILKFLNYYDYFITGDGVLDLSTKKSARLEESTYDPSSSENSVSG